MSVPQQPTPLGPQPFAPMPGVPPTPPNKRANPLTSKPVIGIVALLAGMALGSAGGHGGTPAGVSAAVRAATVTATAVQTITAQAEPAEPTEEPTEEATEEPAAEETAAPEPAKKSYASLSKRKFKLLAKDPDSYIGKTYLVYGNVTQFDSATGTDTFRADAGPKKLRISYGYVDYDQNSIFSGTESKLKKLVEGDCFTAKVTVLGSYSYDTQIGGNTTVPMFAVDSIKVYGSTD